MKGTSPPEGLLKRLRQDHRFLITSHANPDGDAIGSELALARILRSLGKRASIWNCDATPSIYSALPGAESIHVEEAAPSGFPEAFDAVIVLECPTPDRTGHADRLGGLPLFNIDHHLGNDHYGELNWVDTSAAAVGVMVHRLAKELKVYPDEATANCLFLALVTDTGGFRFSNANADAFEAAAALVRDGASPEQVSQWLYESRPEGAVRLLGEILSTLERHGDGRVATVVLEPEMLASAGAQRGDSEGLIDVPRSIAGVDAVALLRRVEDGYKVSLRSRGVIDVEAVARPRGGGGHRNAAGFVVAGPLERARSEVVEALAGAVERATGAADDEEPSPS